MRRSKSVRRRPKQLGLTFDFSQPRAAVTNTAVGWTTLGGFCADALTDEGSMNGMAGKPALVTGEESGIGWVSALRFAEEGADVVVADIAAAEGKPIVEQIDDAGGDATFVDVDISDTDSIERMVDVAVETYGSPEFAHNNAGILTDFVDVTGISDTRWNRIIDVNVKGVWARLKAELPVMKSQGHGAIVNTVSSA